MIAKNSPHQPQWPREPFYFLSYSRNDARTFVTKLIEALEASDVSLWLDRQNLRTIDSWSSQIVEALRRCAGVLYVLTPDSVHDDSFCQNELTFAIRYKKPIIAIQASDDAQLPLSVATRQMIAYSASPADTFNRVINELRWLEGPEGELGLLQLRLRAAQRRHGFAAGTKRQALAQEITRLSAEIARVSERLGVRAISEEAKSSTKVTPSPRHGRQPARLRLLNTPPFEPPRYFQNRETEIERIVAFFREPSLRVLMVTGRSGAGKSTLVLRALRRVNELTGPHTIGLPHSIAALVLSAVGADRLTAAHVLNGLLKAVTAQQRAELMDDWRQEMTAQDKIVSLLRALRDRAIVIVLDNFESMIDNTTQRILDGDLATVLAALLTAPAHAVKVIVTSQVMPVDLIAVRPAAQARIDLDVGLPSPYAENILREMDADGRVGLRPAAPAVLADVAARVAGSPRALEALFAVLSADRDLSVSEVIASDISSLPRDIADAVIGEAYSRLDGRAQNVMQALAIYNRPIERDALAWLLKSFPLATNLRLTLARLVNRGLVKKLGDKYSLHPADRAYALSRIPDRLAPSRRRGRQYDARTLFSRAADYFVTRRTHRRKWKQLDDLAPQLAEFELRCDAEEYDQAALLLMEFDYAYLSLWGYNVLARDCHAKLRNKIEDPGIRLRSLARLGRLEFMLGRYDAAARILAQARVTARNVGERSIEAMALSDLGYCRFYLGQFEAAVADESATLSLLKKVRRSLVERESTKFRTLGILAFAYSAIGRTDDAIQYAHKALTASQEGDDRQEEVIQLGYLGLYHSYKGLTTPALSHCTTSLALARKIGARFAEAMQLGHLCEIHCQRREFVKVTEIAQAAAQFETHVATPLLWSWAYWWLAIAECHLGKEDEALQAVAQACRYDEPLNNPNPLAFQAALHARAGSQVAADSAARKAIAAADALLKKSSRNWEALLAKGIALAAMGAAGDGGGYRRAAKTFSKAFAITSDLGHVRRVLLQLETLRPAQGVDTLVQHVLTCTGQTSAW